MKLKMEFKTALTIISVLIATQSQLSQSAKASGSTKSPVILVPNFGGSRIGAKLINDDSEYSCLSKDNNTLIWLSFDLMGRDFNCFRKVLTLNFTKDGVKDPRNVKSTVYGFGKTKTMEFLNRTLSIVYLGNLVSYLDGAGYTRDKNLTGCPYDFRKSFVDLKNNDTKYKKLIETTYKNNNNKSVSIICHSYGCLTSLYFLNNQEKEWKDKFVKNFIAIGAPWNGFARSIESLISGREVIPGIPPSAFIPLWRSFPSAYSLFPTKYYSNNTLVTIDSMNYTINNMSELFSKLNFTQGYQMWSKYKNNQTWQAPGVNTYCIYANGLPTISSLRYSQQDLGKKLTGASYEDGDGIVTLSSSKVCESWKNEQNHTTDVKVFSDYNHDTIMFSPQMFEYLNTIL